KNRPVSHLYPHSQADSKPFLNMVVDFPETLHDVSTHPHNQHLDLESLIGCLGTIIFVDSKRPEMAKVSRLPRNQTKYSDCDMPNRNDPDGGTCCNPTRSRATLSPNNKSTIDSIVI